MIVMTMVMLTKNDGAYGDDGDGDGDDDEVRRVSR